MSEVKKRWKLSLLQHAVAWVAHICQSMQAVASLNWAAALDGFELQVPMAEGCACDIFNLPRQQSKFAKLSST